MKQAVSKQTKLTKESLANLQAELQELETVQLPAVVKRIAKAREQGDLSENSEYKDAKDQQELLQVRIEEIKIILAGATVIKNSGDSAAAPAFTDTTHRLFPKERP